MHNRGWSSPSSTLPAGEGEQPVEQYQPPLPSPAGTFHKPEKYGRDACQHTACRHGAAKTHGADNQPYRIQHSRHPMRCHQFVQNGITRFNMRTVVENHDQSFEKRRNILYLHAGNLMKQFRKLMANLANGLRLKFKNNYFQAIQDLSK